jgi:hypothetical protein
VDFRRAAFESAYDSFRSLVVKGNPANHGGPRMAAARGTTACQAPQL